MSTEVAVAGAGPAGCAAAIALAKSGRRVLLVTKEPTSRQTIGDSLPPAVRPMLELLGVTSRIEDAGFVRMSGTTVLTAGAVQTHDFSPAGDELGYQVDRDQFDGLLLDEAKRVGCEVLTGWTVLAPRSRSGRVIGLEIRRGDRSRRLDAKLVIDATGRSGAIARAFDVRENVGSAQLAAFGVWSKAERVECELPLENTLFEILDDGWLWSALYSDGTRSITLGTTPERLKGSPDDRLETYLDAISRSKHIRSLCREAQLISQLKLFDATCYRAARASGPGYLLVGDAASFVDPLTSQGVLKALRSGLAAAAVVNTLLEDPSKESIALSCFDELEQALWEEYQSALFDLYGAFQNDSEFWSTRTAMFGEADEVAERAKREREARRAHLAELVQSDGARDLRFRATRPLQLVMKGRIERGRVRERACFLDDSSSPIEVPVNARALAPLLDGRPLNSLFDDYAAESGSPVSSELARAILEAVMRLYERGLVEESND